MADDKKKAARKPDWKGFFTWFKERPAIWVTALILAIICVDPQGAVWNLVYLAVIYLLWRILGKPIYLYIVKPCLPAKEKKDDKPDERIEASLDPRYFGDDSERAKALRDHPLP